jgi:hypothetical protein
MKQKECIILTSKIMEVKELMTGVFVYFNCFDGSKIVVRMTGFKDGIVYGNSEKGSHWCNIEKVEPIPIVAEILGKNGFLANRHVYPYPYYEYTNEEDKLKIGFAFPQGNRTSYKEPWVYIDSENIFIEHLPCVFVHQLQHALKLCGIEKEIVL